MSPGLSVSRAIGVRDATHKRDKLRVASNAESSTGSPTTDRDGSACWSDGSKDKLIDRRGPEWDCTVRGWHLWQWQATMHLNGKGYKATLEGENRDDANVR